MRNVLRKIIERQRGEWREKLGRRYVPRKRFSVAERALRHGLIKVIIGPRRAGKSVLAAMLLKDRRAAYFNFDEMGAVQVDTELLVPELVRAYGAFDYVFLDEVQNLDGWQLFLNRLQREGVNVVASGSNANLLSGELATHLTGRYTQIEVLPFSFTEFLQARKLQGSVVAQEELATAYLRTGGYPEVIMNQDMDTGDYLRTLTAAILNKDIVARYRIRKPDELGSVAEWAFSNVAKEMSYERIAVGSKEGGLPAAGQTVKKYLGYLAEAYMTTLVGRYEHGHRERLRSPRKLYAIDNGLAAAVGFRSSPDNGRLLENLVHGELCKAGGFDKLRYFRTTQGGREVDFVVQKGFETTALIQACWDMSDRQTRKREVAGLVAAVLETRCTNAIIVTWTEHDSIDVDGLTIQVIPFYEWAKLIDEKSG